MAWGYSFTEKPELAEEFLYKVLLETRGACAPSLKQEVRAKKGVIEKVRRLATLHTASDWDRITQKGIVSLVCGRMMSLIPVEGTKGLGTAKAGEARTMSAYRKFAEVAANDKSARYKILIEIVMFRCGYQAPDLVEKVYRNHPALRTAAQIGTPMALRIAKGVASAGIGVGAEAAGGSAGLGDAFGGFGGTAVEGLLDVAISRAEDAGGLATPSASKGKVAPAALPLAVSYASRGHRAVVCELENPHTQDALGVAGLGVRHRIAVFQVTPLRYTNSPDSKTRMISAFHKSVIGARTFRDMRFGAASGLQTGVAALNYASFYDNADRQPFLTSIGLVEEASMSGWMENPTYYLRDAAVSTAAQVEKLGANPGADIFHGHYEQWKSSAAVRAIA